MPTTYSTPGVYINEVPAQNRPIEGVATSVAAFVGLAPNGPANVPIQVTSWTEFARTFGIEGDPSGPYMDGAYLAHAVAGFFGNGGTNCWIVRIGEETFGGRPQGALMSAEVANQPAFHVVAKDDVEPFPTITVVAENAEEVETQRAAAESAADERKQAIEKAADDLRKAREAKDAAKSNEELATAEKGLADAEKALADANGLAPDADGRDKAIKDATGEVEKARKARDAAKVTATTNLATAETALVAAEKAFAQASKPDLDAPSTPIPTFTVTVTRGDDGEDETYEHLTATPGPNFLLTAINTRSKLIELTEPGETLTVAQRAPSPSAGMQLAPIRREDIEKPRAVALNGDPDKLTGLAALAANDQITMVCVPDLMALQQSDKDIRGVQTQLITMCSQTKRMAILDPPPGLTPQEIGAWRKNPATPPSEYAALYWPWVRVVHPVSGDTVEIPPCGHVAGIWARTDDRRGVHKAPANEEIMGVIDLASDVSDTAQGDLNMNGVNCLRAFRGRGMYTWGARTLATTTKAEWRYINVRRLFNYVSASILRGTQWAVFEPNDETLWNQLNVSVGNFLTTVWRTGAFVGSTPDQAFFVKCDRSTNPPDLVDAGQVNIHIGIAPVKPAEFVVFQISQYQPPAAG